MRKTSKEVLDMIVLQDETSEIYLVIMNLIFGSLGVSNNYERKSKKLS